MALVSLLLLRSSGLGARWVSVEEEQNHGGGESVDKRGAAELDRDYFNVDFTYFYMDFLKKLF